MDPRHHYEGYARYRVIGNRIAFESQSTSRRAIAGLLGAAVEIPILIQTTRLPCAVVRAIGALGIAARLGAATRDPFAANRRTGRGPSRAGEAAVVSVRRIGHRSIERRIGARRIEARVEARSIRRIRIDRFDISIRARIGARPIARVLVDPRIEQHRSVRLRVERASRCVVAGVRIERKLRNTATAAQSDRDDEHGRDTRVQLHKASARPKARLLRISASKLLHLSRLISRVSAACLPGSDPRLDPHTSPPGEPRSG